MSDRRVQRQLSDASDLWVEMKAKAENQATLERRRYGEARTTAADVVDQETPLISPVLRDPRSRAPRSKSEGHYARPRSGAGFEECVVINTSEDDVDYRRAESKVYFRELPETPEQTAPRQHTFSVTTYDSLNSGEMLQQNAITRKVTEFRSNMSQCLDRNYDRIKSVSLVILFLLFAAYFGWVLSYDPQKGMTLIVIVALGVFMSVYGFVRDYYGGIFDDLIFNPVAQVIDEYWKYLKWGLVLLILAALGLFIGFEVAKNPIQLRSLCGMVLILTFSFLNSTNPGAVRWRPVILGIGLQIIMGFLVLRWKPGYEGFYWLSSKVQDLLNYADYGAKFIFGDPQYLDHPIAFKVIPMVIFFSAFINMMVYLGVMQVVITKVSWLMQRTMYTTTIETLSVAGNVFFTLAEESFILRPYMMKLTKSELHAVMTGGSATAAGFSLAMYIQLGAPAIHVFSAAVMSAPAALAIAKLSYPETEKSLTKTEADVKLESGTEANVLEAAAAGATMSITVISYAVAILIAFFALLGLFNDILAWLGDMVGYPDFSFELICSYVFYPVAYFMGVPAKDCRKVASMMGIKYFGSDLIAYTSMGKMREAGTIDDRSAMIGTYALLGFSSLSSVGVNIGILGALCPERRADVSGMALRAILNGNMASLLTACLAGFLNPE